MDNIDFLTKRGSICRRNCLWVPHSYKKR